MSSVIRDVLLYRALDDPDVTVIFIKSPKAMSGVKGVDRVRVVSPARPGDLWRIMSSPSGVWGTAPAENDF